MSAHARIEISYQNVAGGERTTSGIVPVTDDEIPQLFQSPGVCGPGWAHLPLAENRIVYLMRRRVIPDEVPPVETASDLRRLGIAGLRAKLRDEMGNVNSLTLI